MPNPYVNKVVTSSGTTLIDISESNIAIDDVLYGKTFYDASGAPQMGSVLLGTEYITPSNEKQIFIPPIDSVELIDEIQGSNVALEKSQKNYLQFNTGSINNNIPCLLAGTIDVHWSYTEQLGDSYSGTWTFVPSGVPLELYDESLDDYIENDYLYISRYDYDRGLHGRFGTFSATYSGDTTWKCNQPDVTIQSDTMVITPIPATSAGSYSFSCDYHLYLYKPVFAGYKFYSAIEVEAASGGTPSQAQHTILFEFTDETSQSITGYWDSSFISDAITATEPTTIGQKTVDSAALDGVTWYTRPTIQWETLFDDAVGFHPDETPPAYCWITELGDIWPAVGSVWRITFDGVLYDNLIATRIVAPWNGLEQVILGNASLYGEEFEDTGEPFVFYNMGYGAWSGGVEGPNVESQHALKVERQIVA